jgi:phosphohistidine phosphatase SixA
MKVYFLRHGIAADTETWHGDDADRPLTEKGRTKMAREAATIEELSLGLDTIVTSPLIRARQTGRIVAEKLGMLDRLQVDERLGLDFDTTRLADIVQAHNAADALMLVGHEPGMSETIGLVVGRARVVLKKGALALVDLTDPTLPSGDLLWLVPPKILAR